MRRLVALVLVVGLGLMAALLPWRVRRGSTGNPVESPVSEPGSVGDPVLAALPASVAEGTRERPSPEAFPRSPAQEPLPTATSLELVDCLVQVMRDGEPLGGLEVGNGHPWALGSAPASLSVGDPPATQVQTTDANVIARFTDLPRGLSAFWLLLPEREPLRFSGVTSTAGASALLVPLGRAAVEGHVYRFDGLPAQDANVYLLQMGLEGESRVWQAAVTNEKGAYEIGDLAGGEGRRIFVGTWAYSIEESAPIILAPGERRRIDFGSPSERGR